MPAGTKSSVPSATPTERVKRSRPIVSRPASMTNAPESPAASAAPGKRARPASVSRTTTLRRDDMLDLQGPDDGALRATARPRTMPRRLQSCTPEATDAVPALQRTAAPSDRAAGALGVRRAGGTRACVRGLPQRGGAIAVAGAAAGPHRVRGFTVPVLLRVRG